MFDRIRSFGSDGEPEEPDNFVNPDELKTPLPLDVVMRAHKHCTKNEILSENDRDLVTVLNAVQIYIDNHELLDKPGNAFFEDLVQAFDNSKSLRVPLKLQGNTLFAVILDEGYQALKDDLDLTQNEINAVRDAHHIYADTAGLSKWAYEVNILAIHVSDARRQGLVNASEAVANVAESVPDPDAEQDHPDKEIIDI